MENGCRTEKKYIISLAAAGALRERLSPLMQPDPQATCGTYRIRSLYFDTLDSDAFWEKAEVQISAPVLQRRSFVHSPGTEGEMGGAHPQDPGGGGRAHRSGHADG